jgi:hypothetical protein
MSNYRNGSAAKVGDLVRGAIPAIVSPKPTPAREIHGLVHDVAGDDLQVLTLAQVAAAELPKTNAPGKPHGLSLGGKFYIAAIESAAAALFEPL